MLLSPTTLSFLPPLLTLIFLTFFIESLMYFYRITNMIKYKIQFDPRRQTIQQGINDKLPPHTTWAAANYNHLHEQPTVFYAIGCIGMVMSMDGNEGKWGDNLVFWLWIYVILRVIHSFWQSFVNGLMPRFFLFLSSSVVLAWTAILVGWRAKEMGAF